MSGWDELGREQDMAAARAVGYTEGNVFDYLADLVDRGECENVYDGSVQDSCDNGFLCSVCGCKVEDEEHYRVSGVWNYCPQCGRKVRHG